MAAGKRYCVNRPDVIHETIEGEAVMINLRSGNYYSLEGTGADVWHLLERGATTEEIVADLAGAYGAPSDTITADVAALLDELSREELITIGDDEGVPAAGPPPAAQEYRAPRLAIFTDMQDLILLDPIHDIEPRGWLRAPDDGVKARD